MRTLPIILVMLFLVGFTTTCTNDFDMARARLDFGATRSGKTLSSGRVGNEITLEAIWLGIREIELEMEEGEGHHDGDHGMGEQHHDDGNDEGDDDQEDSDENSGENHHESDHEWEGAYIVELISGTSDPELPVIDLLPGKYDEFEAKLAPIIDDRYSIRIEGDCGGTAFTFLYEKPLKFEAENEEGFVIDENILNTILVNIDVDGWLAGADICSGLMNDSGEIIISADSNTGIYAAIESSLHSLAKIGKDDDHDHEIDD